GDGPLPDPAFPGQRQENVVHPRRLRTPAALVGLIAHAEIEDARALTSGFLDDQPEKQFAGACLRAKLVVDRAELAKDVAALARQAGNGDDATGMLAA